MISYLRYKISLQQIIFYVKTSTENQYYNLKMWIIKWLFYRPFISTSKVPNHYIFRYLKVMSPNIGDNNKLRLSRWDWKPAIEMKTHQIYCWNLKIEFQYLWELEILRWLSIIFTYKGFGSSLCNYPLKKVVRIYRFTFLPTNTQNVNFSNSELISYCS